MTDKNNNHNDTKLDAILRERLSSDKNTVTIPQLTSILEPYHNKDLLTPRESNILTFHLVELAMDGNCDIRVMKLMARYLSRKAYGDLVEERVTNHYCGYPRCKYTNPDQIKQVELNKLEIKLKMPRFYNSRFCCKRHYQASEFYRRQLSSEALFMRTHMSDPFFSKDTDETLIVLLEEYFDAREKANSESPEVDELMKLMEKMKIDRDTVTAENEKRQKLANSGVNGGIQTDNKMTEDIEIVEKEGPQKSKQDYNHNNQIKDDKMAILRSLN